MAWLDRPDGARLYYRVVDLTPPWLERPPTVLFQHGIGSDADIWWRWLPLLAERCRLVLLDARGVSRSTPPPGPFVPELSVLSDDLLAVAACAGADRFHLVGDSMGGTVAYATAARRPAAVASLMVMSGPWRGGRIEHADAWEGQIARLGMDGWSELMLDERFAPGSLDAAETAWIRRLQAAQRPDVVVGLARMLLQSDLGAELPRIGCPSLLVYPDDSPFVRPENLDDLRACMPKATLEVVAGARHSIASTHAGTLARRYARFLDLGA